MLRNKQDLDTSEFHLSFFLITRSVFFWIQISYFHFFFVQLWMGYSHIMTNTSFEISLIKTQIVKKLQIKDYLKIYIKLLKNSLSLSSAIPLVWHYKSAVFPLLFSFTRLNLTIHFIVLFGQYKNIIEKYFLSSKFKCVFYWALLEFLNYCFFFFYMTTHSSFVK